MLAIGRCSKPIHDFSHLIQISKIERRFGTERKPNAVCRQRNLIDQVEYFRPDARATIQAMVDRDFKNIETIKILARPAINGRTVPDPDRGLRSGFCHHATQTSRRPSLGFWPGWDGSKGSEGYLGQSRRDIAAGNFLLSVA